MSENEKRTTNVLQVLVLTPRIREHLQQHDPKVLEQAIAALRDTLPEAELKSFEESLARVSSEASKIKQWEARIMVYLPKPHWSSQTLDGQTCGQVLFEGPSVSYLSRS